MLSFYRSFSLDIFRSSKSGPYSSVILTRLSGLHSRPATSQKNLVAPGIKPGTSGSVARDSDHWTGTSPVGINTYFSKISVVLCMFCVRTATQFAVVLVFQLLSSFRTCTEGSIVILNVYFFYRFASYLESVLHTRT
jgi:hypothetical protein